MKDCLVIRTLSGISGDMMLTGLVKLSELTASELDGCIAQIGLPALAGCLDFEEVLIGGVAGFRARIRLEREPAHRCFGAIRKIISDGAMSGRAKEISQKAFYLLAQAEAEIHKIALEEVVFHEIGGLDSILDICLCAIVYDRMGFTRTVSGALPVCDGVIECAHGRLSSPAPAALELLKDVPVYGVDSKGETVTPTGIAILKALGTQFENWPKGTLRKTVFVYGGRVLPNIPNGVTFSRLSTV